MRVREKCYSTAHETKWHWRGSDAQRICQGEARTPKQLAPAPVPPRVSMETLNQFTIGTHLTRLLGERHTVRIGTDRVIVSYEGSDGRMTDETVLVDDSPGIALGIQETDDSEVTLVQFEEGVQIEESLANAIARMITVSQPDVAKRPGLYRP